MLYIKFFNAPVAVATHSAAIRRKCWSPLVAKVAKVARANTMAGFIIFFHINDDFWRLWTLVLMMMLDRRSSSDPNWSVVVGSPRPQTKERPAVAGPCLICIFLLLRCNKEISPFTCPSLPMITLFSLSLFSFLQPHFLPSYISCSAVLVARIQSWSFFDAFYFCFMTLFTVGLGGLSPNQVSINPIQWQGDRVDLCDRLIKWSYIPRSEA